MKSLPGDKKMGAFTRGIGKTTQVDVDIKNHGSSAPEDLERGDGS